MTSGSDRLDAALRGIRRPDWLKTRLREIGAQLALLTHHSTALDAQIELALMHGAMTGTLAPPPPAKDDPVEPAAPAIAHDQAEPDPQPAPEPCSAAQLLTERDTTAARIAQLTEERQTLLSGWRHLHLHAQHVRL